MRAQPWAAAFEGRSYNWRPTVEEANGWARNVGTMVAHPPTFKDYVGGMQRVNPQLVLATYSNLVLIDMTQRGTSTLPESAFSVNANGDFMTGSDATYARLINPLDPAAIDFKCKDAVARMASSGYPDLYMDVASPSAPFGPYMSGPPVDPRTGLPWTVKDWAAACTDLELKITAAVEAAKGSKVKTVLNSLSNGPAYWTVPTSVSLRPGVYASVCEGWLRASSTAPADKFPTAKAWKQCVDLIVDAELKGFIVLPMVKVWVSATASQQQKWADYSTCTFLLASDGRSRLELSFYKGDSLVVKPAQQTELGTPTGAYKRETSGVYSREFSNGKVYVNPTVTALVHQGVNVPANTGRILL